MFDSVSMSQIDELKRCHELNLILVGQSAAADLESELNKIPSCEELTITMVLFSIHMQSLLLCRFVLHLSFNNSGSGT